MCVCVCACVCGCACVVWWGGGVAKGVQQEAITRVISVWNTSLQITAHSQEVGKRCHTHKLKMQLQGRFIQALPSVLYSVTDTWPMKQFHVFYCCAFDSLDSFWVINHTTQGGKKTFFMWVFVSLRVVVTSDHITRTWKWLKTWLWTSHGHQCGMQALHTNKNPLIYTKYVHFKDIVSKVKSVK